MRVVYAVVYWAGDPLRAHARVHARYVAVVAIFIGLFK
jgi:formylmethanofuran dehydrogenase subunit B